MKVYSIMADGITEEPIIVKDVKDAEKIHSFLTHLYNEKNNTDYFTFAEREKKMPNILTPMKLLKNGEYVVM